MQLKGKLVGGIIGLILLDLAGLPLGGLIGFVFGSILGHLFIDLPLMASEGADVQAKAYRRRQGELIFHVFRMCAKIAKSDGRINHAEVQLMERLMVQHFRLSDGGRQQAIRIWKEAKDSGESFDTFARAFYRDFARDRYQVMNVMDILFAVAAADGRLHPREEELLLRAAGIFHISRLQYDRIKARYYQAPPREQQRWSPLDPHYAILGAAPHESLDDIKKKFRKLAMEWHPDKMLARGASQEALRHAKEKFQQINEAYERILEARSGR
jgi:DnaJ like chaperone protein